MFFLNKTKAFAAFVEQLKSNSDDILKDLQLKEDDFLTVPHKFILDNPNDVAIGVTKVKIKTDLSIFEMFNSTLIKYVDSGEIIYILYTTTINHTSIEEISKTLFEKLGLGLYDSDRDYTFKDTFRIKELSTNTQNERKSILNVWQTEKYSVVLQYMIEPLHQFALRITKKVPKIIDRASKKGTILDLIKIDVNKFLIYEEFEKEVGYKEDGRINYVDYVFKLDTVILGVFDILTVRLFSEDRVFNLKTQTHLSFTSSTQKDLKKLLKVCDEVLKIYGSDMSGYLDLDIGEVETLEINDYWTGRRWHFNEVNGLRLPGDKTIDVYWVELSNGVNDDGFKLFIGCYNKLVEYFNVD